MKTRPGQSRKQAAPIATAMLTHTQPMAVERDFSPQKGQTGHSAVSSVCGLVSRSWSTSTAGVRRHLLRRLSRASDRADP